MDRKGSRRALGPTAEPRVADDLLKEMQAILSMNSLEASRAANRKLKNAPLFPPPLESEAAKDDDDAEEGEERGDEMVGSKLDELLVAVTAKTFFLAEMDLLAKVLGIKRKGTWWGRGGTPRRKTWELASALIDKRNDVMAFRSLDARLEESQEDCEEGREKEVESQVEDDEVELESQKARDPEVVETKFEVGGKTETNAESVEAVKTRMNEDFSMKDVVDLAKRYGVKRPGVGWGSKGTPKQRKASIIEALIEGHLRELRDNLQCKLAPVPQIDTGQWLNFTVQEFRAPVEYMSRGKYRAYLARTMGVSNDQHVFHIIASANGGPDHPDNYIGALAGVFNCSAGCRLDYFCCFVAGLEKSEKAVARALEAESLYRQDPQRYRRVIDRRGRPEPRLFSENVFCREAGRCVTAAELVERGRLAWAKMRLAALTC
eukprot:TRINITY_DN43340_c0_g1_i1.p1 TRINITY_DN43340_c0_g1~~TRINITY_DN43340_c0_g1_i1.p1  ORF type:complete len:433 (-),score=90.76 TRINITY_DN43340_c0_g1_i1:83-1381(-)